MECEKVWFVAVDSKALGPLDDEAAEMLVESDPNALLWWQGQSNWVSPTEWMEMRGEVTARRGGVYFLDHERHIPRSLPETIDLLMPSLGDIKAIKLWSHQANRNLSVYEVPEICMHLGISGRKYIRTALRGSAALKIDGQEIIAQLSSISISGIGLEVSLPVGASKDCTIEICSGPMAGTGPIEVTALYCQNGTTGFSFKALDRKTQDLISAYVRSREGASFHSTKP
jgi:hypothetical protein